MKNDIAIAINNILSATKGKKYASLSEIYKEVSRIRNCEQDRILEAQVRARLQEHCSEYKNYNGKEDLFETYSFNSGLWKNKITGEREIKKYVFQVLKEFPGIDITNLQSILLSILEKEGKLTFADRLESKTRPGEMKIEQIIRNFVSHKNSYKDSIDYVVDDSVVRLYLKDTNLDEDISVDPIKLESKQISEILEEEKEIPSINDQESLLEMTSEIPSKGKKKKTLHNVYVRKSDFKSYVADYKKKLDNGYAGEALVYEFERNKLIQLGREDLAERIKWISRDNGDGFGYDIQSFEVINGRVSEIFIEVKSSASSLNSDFEISSNELEFAKCHPDSYRLYRIYRKGKVTKGFIIDYNSFGHFDFIPNSYRVSIKNIDEN